MPYVFLVAGGLLTLSQIFTDSPWLLGFWVGAAASIGGIAVIINRRWLDAD